jgi:hypothetical protein
MTAEQLFTTAIPLEEEWSLRQRSLVLAQLVDHALSKFGVTSIAFAQGLLSQRYSNAEVLSYYLQPDLPCVTADVRSYWVSSASTLPTARVCVVKMTPWTQ